MRGGGGGDTLTSHAQNYKCIIKHIFVETGPELNRLGLDVCTVGRWMMELLEVTVCSPSCIMAISLLLSSEASARLLTELLCELAEMDMLGTDWELSMLLTVPVRSRYCSTS